MAIDYICKEDIDLQFHDGYAQTELLPGVYPMVKSYRCVVQTGATTAQTAAPGKITVIVISEGRGYITTPEQAYSIDGLCFFMANPGEAFSVTAAQELTMTMFQVEMGEWEQEQWEDTHMALPAFKTLRECDEYCQSSKTPTARNWFIIGRKLLPRTIMGYVQAGGEGEEGAIDKGHPRVAQWNIILDDSDINLTVDGETVSQKAGDFSYVEAGLDHALVSKPGKSLKYIWFEHFVEEYKTQW